MTVYKARSYSDGYESDFTTNTQYSEGTFVFQVDTEFNTSASVNSNGEIEGNLPNELTLNAATLLKSILRNTKQSSRRNIPRSSQMSAGAPEKLLANQQMRIVKPDGNTYGHMTSHGMMVLVNYARCDSLIPNKITSPEIHYKVNLLQTIGGANLALCDGRANGCIKGNDMQVLYYNSDGRRVSIGVTGDH